MGPHSGRIPSQMHHSFSRSPSANIPRSSFNRSCNHKTTFDAGFLIPIFLDEALPGDTFNLRMTAFGRLATPIFPVMDNMFLETFFFAVPYRLVWDNWQKFNGEQKNPGDSTSFLVPTMTATAGTGYLNSSLHDYFGIPTGVAGLVHDSLFHRGYNLIWNEWFRDENLQNSVVVDTDDGPDSPTDYQLLRRGKRYDYFTSCLPFPQKGVAVPLPLSGNANVYGNGKALGLTDGTTSLGLSTPASGSSLTEFVNGYNTNVGSVTSGSAQNPWPSNRSIGVVQSPYVSGLVADLSTATAATINQLRQAFQIQKLYERDARGGTRYIEIIRSHFGVISPDARLQRPEFLGGGHSTINIVPVPQTSSTDATTPQGNLSAFGVVSASGHGFTKSFTEHCLILGLVCVRADLSYQQGLNRMFSRQTRFDYYWPALSHIGEQAVLNKEIYAKNDANDGLTFGYQERYAEYRYKPSLITGQFRSNFAQTLDKWHLSQNFGSLPVLNSTFIQEDPPVDRVIAVPTFPHIIFDSYFDLKCARPMPMYSVPGLIDHF